jgi:hypothetical protein
MRALLLVCAGALTACSSGTTYDYVPLGGGSAPAIRTVPIDTGATLGPEQGPGNAIGVFVEYTTGGAWHVFTVCDTDRSGLTCHWDIVASVAKGTLDPKDSEIDPTDEILRVDSGALRLLLDTRSEVDSVRLLADPGENLQIDVTLDGNYDPSYALGFVFSVSGGTSDGAGAPSNPVVFSPTEP